MAHKAEYIWRYRDIDVIYELAVEGGGIRIAPALIDFVQRRFGADRHFGTVFEWCAGPGFIGFSLLAEGMCNSLCLADINPAAIECVNRTIRTNQLQDRVRAYVSDNMASVPPDERFDLVIGSPPPFCALNPAHPSYSHVTNLINHDPDWKVHAAFWNQIAAFLNPNALVLTSEANLYERVVLTPGCSIPLDIRPEEPHQAFANMIRNGGLVHIDNSPYDPGDPILKAWFNLWVQIAQKPA